MTAPVSHGQIRVTVWNEAEHETLDASVKEIYPAGMHGAIRDGIAGLLGDQVTIRIATLAEPDHGLSEEVLAQTDVLTWWGHRSHQKVSDEVVERVRKHVLAGMGLLVMHSGHASKIFTRMVGTGGTLIWRNEAERELVWTVTPSHPIAVGVPNPIIIPHQEMYGEPFGIPQPDELVFISSFEGGEVFRGGCVFYRGNGRIFYFSPGDQEYPVYHHPDIHRVLANAVCWLAQPDEVRASPPSWGNPARNWFMKS